MKEWEVDFGSYGLRYTIRDEKVYITAATGNALTIDVPECIEGKRVAGIDKKAFLSKKNLKEVTLPAGLENIGDWAFAFCRKLERVTIPVSCTEIGKSIFQECEKLEWIGESRPGVTAEDLKREEEREEVQQEGITLWNRQVGYLLATAVGTVMDTDYLLTPNRVGSAEWLEQWDKKLDAILAEADSEGYDKQILCGEEDYGSTDLNAFLREKRKKKVKISMLRLLNSVGLSAERSKRLTAYVLGHSKGETSEESWLVLRDELFEKRGYVQLFLDLGCVNIDNVDSMIQDVSAEKAELKAMLLRYKEEYLTTTDFFGGLML